MKLLTVLLVLGSCLLAAQAGKLKEEFTWSYITYAMVANTSVCNQPEGSDDGGIAFPDDDNSNNRYSKMNSAPSGQPITLPNLPNDEFTAENNIPMGTNRYKDRIFITVPRRRVGIPSTLNYVSLNCKARHNVPLTPYPSWEMNHLSTTTHSDPTDVNIPIVSVYRTTVDQCNRLWLVDMGILEYPTGRQQIQQGAIVVIDLNTDKVIRRHPIKASDANARSTLADITVDVTKDTCDDAYAYIPDLVNYRMVVYSWRERDTWLVNHNFFHFLPRGGELFIGGFNFAWNDGVFSIVLSRRQPDGFRNAYFHAMASNEEFTVNTRVLRNRTLATRGYHGNDFVFVGDRGKDGQSSTHALHQPSGVVFFGMVMHNGLGCWNSRHPFSKASFDLVHTDPAKMIYPGDVRVDMQDNVWMMTNSMPVFLYGTLDYSRVNFRIWTSSIRDAIRGTKCER